jgi:hypothetical protein
MTESLVTSFALQQGRSKAAEPMLSGRGESLLAWVLAALQPNSHWEKFLNLS